jgi:hypothetical protein
MKSIVLTALSFILVSLLPANSMAGHSSDNAMLQKEIAGIFRNGNLKNMSGDTQEVTIRFLINAQHEVVIFDASGDSDAACEHVKEVLNYRQVKFKEAKQLMPYEISILFVKKAEQ